MNDVTETKPQWWCADCGVNLDPRDVTYEETHDERRGGCGLVVTFDDGARQHMDDAGLQKLLLQQADEIEKAGYSGWGNTMREAAGRISAMRYRLHRILEAPQDTLSDGKALREIVRQARLGLATKE